MLWLEEKQKKVSGAMSASNEHSAVFITRLKVNSRLSSRYLKSEGLGRSILVILWVVATIPDFHTGGLGSVPLWGILHFSPTFWKKANFQGLLQPFKRVQR